MNGLTEPVIFSKKKSIRTRNGINRTIRWEDPKNVSIHDASPMQSIVPGALVRQSFFLNENRDALFSNRFSVGMIIGVDDHLGLLVWWYQRGYDKIRLRNPYNEIPLVSHWDQPVQLGTGVYHSHRNKR